MSAANKQAVSRMTGIYCWEGKCGRPIGWGRIKVISKL
jgi:hypothetical protein